MSDEMMLSIADANEARHARVHGELAFAAVAALAADPETLADLDPAIERYARRDGTRGFFEGWSPGVSDEPCDEGVSVIDLAARLAAWQSTGGPAPESHGKVTYHDPNSPGDIQLRYRLSDEWLITGIEGWQSRAAQRRAERLARPLFDFRPLLYLDATRAAPGTVGSKRNVRHGDCRLPSGAYDGAGAAHRGLTPDRLLAFAPSGAGALLEQAVSIDILARPVR